MGVEEKMCIRDSIKVCFTLDVVLIIWVKGINPVSYTHLDVYKRQGSGVDHIKAGVGSQQSVHLAVHTTQAVDVYKRQMAAWPDLPQPRMRTPSPSGSSVMLGAFFSLEISVLTSALARSGTALFATPPSISTMTPLHTGLTILAPNRPFSVSYTHLDVYKRQPWRGGWQSLRHPPAPPQHRP